MFKKQKICHENSEIEPTRWRTSIVDSRLCCKNQCRTKMLVSNGYYSMNRTIQIQVIHQFEALSVKTSKTLRHCTKFTYYFSSSPWSSLSTNTTSGVTALKIQLNSSLCNYAQLKETLAVIKKTKKLADHNSSSNNKTSSNYHLNERKRSTVSRIGISRIEVG